VEAGNHAKHKMHYWFDISPERVNKQPSHFVKVMVWCVISLFVTIAQYLHENLWTANKVTLISNQHIKMLQTFMEPELEKPDTVQPAWQTMHILHITKKKQWLALITFHFQQHKSV
jgi:hypothetical protein